MIEFNYKSLSAMLIRLHNFRHIQYNTIYNIQVSTCKVYGNMASTTPI